MWELIRMQNDRHQKKLVQAATEAHALKQQKLDAEALLHHRLEAMVNKKNELKQQL